jgi:hypothetical protein
VVHGGLVDRQEPERLPVEHPHGLRVRIEEQPVVLLRIAQGRFGPPQVGDVADDAERATLRQAHDARLPVPLLPFDRDREVEVLQCRARPHPLERLAGPRLRVLGREVHEGPADHVAGGVGLHRVRTSGRVVGKDAAVGVQRDEEVRQRLQHAAKFGVRAQQLVGGELERTLEQRAPGLEAPVRLVDRLEQTVQPGGRLATGEMGAQLALQEAGGHGHRVIAPQRS